MFFVSHCLPMYYWLLLQYFVWKKQWVDCGRGVSKILGWQYVHIFGIPNPFFAGRRNVFLRLSPPNSLTVRNWKWLIKWFIACFGSLFSVTWARKCLSSSTSQDYLPRPSLWPAISRSDILYLLTPHVNNLYFCLRICGREITQRNSIFREERGVMAILTGKVSFKGRRKKKEERVHCCLMSLGFPHS